MEGTPLPPVPSATTPQRTMPRWVIFAIIAGLLSCLCIAVGLFTVGRGLIGLASEPPVIEPVLDSFMQAMVKRDSQQALTLFSTRAQRQIQRADLDELLRNENYVLFDGYQSLTIDSTNLSSVVNANPDVPQGQVATVNGTVQYAHDIKGTFTATLEKEDGRWRLHAINITVPPTKQLP